MCSFKQPHYSSCWHRTDEELFQSAAEAYHRLSIVTSLTLLAPGCMNIATVLRCFIMTLAHKPKLWWLWIACPCIFHSPSAQVLQALMPVLFGQLYSLKNMLSSGCPWASLHTTYKEKVTCAWKYSMQQFWEVFSDHLKAIRLLLL